MTTTERVQRFARDMAFHLAAVASYPFPAPITEAEMERGRLADGADAEFDVPASSDSLCIHCNMAEATVADLVCAECYDRVMARTTSQVGSAFGSAA